MKHGGISEAEPLELTSGVTSQLQVWSEPQRAHNSIPSASWSMPEALESLTWRLLGMWLQEAVFLSSISGDVYTRASSRTSKSEACSLGNTEALKEDWL